MSIDNLSTKWTINYLGLAKHIAEWSKDPSTKCGAIAIGKHMQILSVGFNGFPRKIEDTAERLNDRPTKYSLMVHAEMNCIYNATLNGISLDDATMFVYGLPVCSECAKGIIQSGIKKIVASYPPIISDKWREMGQLTSQMFEECGIEYYSL
jgi:dCMP deaminase